MNKLILYSVITLIACSCGNRENDEKPGYTDEVKASKLENLNWLLGTWKMQTPEGMFIEHWEKVSDSSYNGKGIMISPSGDTAFSENIQLVVAFDTIWYIPQINDQNDGKAIRFAAKSLTGTSVAFENPTHDFPQRILYNKSSDSTLYARIERMDGSDKTEYQYKKAK